MLFSCYVFCTLFLWNFKSMASVSSETSSLWLQFPYKCWTLRNSYHNPSLLLWFLVPSILPSTWQLPLSVSKEPQTQQIQNWIIKSPPKLTPSPIPYPRDWHWSLSRIPRQKSMSCAWYFLLHYPSPIESARQDHWFYPPKYISDLSPPFLNLAAS